MTSSAAWCRLRDAYGTTAVITIDVAERLLGGGAPRAGALTPTELLGEDADAFLRQIGADWAMC